jgi:hypothetical protein
MEKPAVRRKINPIRQISTVGPTQGWLGAPRDKRKHKSSVILSPATKPCVKPNRMKNAAGTPKEMRSYHRK